MADTPDPALADARAHAARRVQIMRNVGARPRASDLFLLEEPHTHRDGHCCPIPDHEHHVDPHTMCALR